MKNNHGFSNILIISIALILGLSLYYIYTNFDFNFLTKQDFEKTEIISLNPVQEIDSIMTNVESKFKKIDVSLFKPIEYKDDLLTWWISEDNYSILVRDSKGFVVSFIPNKKYEDISIEDFDNFFNIVESELIARNFKLNSINSSKKREFGDNTEFFDYVQAYEKAGIKCISNASPDKISANPDNEAVYIDFTFSCITELEYSKKYELHKPFLKELYKELIKENPSTKLSDIAIVMEDIQENKANMSVGFRRTGGVAFFYKAGTDWAVVHSGQGAPTCKSLEEKGIPKEFWMGCF